MKLTYHLEHDETDEESQTIAHITRTTEVNGLEANVSHAVETLESWAKGLRDETVKITCKLSITIEA